MEAIERISSQAQLQTVIGHIQAGNIEAAILALRIDPVFFQPLDRAIVEAYYQGGVLAMAALPRLKDPFPVVRRFLDLTDAMSEPKPGDENTSGQLIAAITEDARAAARERIVEGIGRNDPPAKIARALVGVTNPVTKKREGGIIGLNSVQSRFINAAEAKLRSGDPELMREYFSLSTRDKRFDRIVRKAIEEGKPVKAEDLTKIIGRLRTRTSSFAARRLPGTRA